MVTGTIATTVLTVSAVTSGTLAVGQTITGGTILPNIYITALGTGTGGTGTYTINATQTVSTATTISASIGVPAVVTGTISGTTLTVSAGGTLYPGNVITGTGILPNTLITAGAGATYTVSRSQTVSPATEITVGQTFYQSPTSTLIADGGTFAVGQGVYGRGIPSNTTITALGTGAGGAGTYSLTAAPLVFVGSITTTALTVSQVISGVLGVDTVISGPGVTPNTTITALGTGTGGTGIYTIGTSQTVSAPAIMYGASTAVGKPMWTKGDTLNVTNVSPGSLLEGQSIWGPGIPSGTSITALAAGTSGGAGTYTISSPPAIVTASQATNTLTVTVVHSGTLAVGQTVSVSPNTNQTVIVND